MGVWYPILAIGIGWGLAIAPLSPAPAQPATPPQSTGPTTPATHPSSPQTVTLTLAEVIRRVIQSNRDLKNAGLDRILQRQELKEAESSFNPRFTPSITLGITQSLTASPSPLSPASSISSSTPSTPAGSISNVSGIGKTVTLGDRTLFNSSAQVQAQLTTRIGTRLSLTSDPLSSFPLSFTITQPLLRGFGKSVNEAPVQVARLTNTKGALALRQTLIDKITETINAYRILYQRQEAVQIQESALTNKRYQLEVATALVKAGRKARADLVDIEQSIADGERQLIETKNQLVLANSALLRLIDTPDSFTILVRADSIEMLIQAAIARTQSLDPTRLLKTAYLNRPDYLQAKLDIETEQLNLIGAQDNKRWGLDLQSYTSLGTSSQTAASLVLSREFGNQRLETEVQRRQIGMQKNTNRLNQLTAIIKTELDNQLQTIRATQKQVLAAQQTSTLAKRQLEIAQERFKRGKITIFELTQKEDTLTTARNNELNARLEFLQAMNQLDRILGTTLTTWSAFTVD